ncbi:OLC1v1011166C1 [Oldenlandia corymbosa var. corymbosa]|uniref:chitinase n=1 Tax=Oldenlandia corymbosa var. corymbosa TaxID=529605 RepID=A0AAV1DWA4_OLDCO|nr:OLC1v1011166C1 [Oldenlandia corymbosa var. corymbosa]
MQFIYVQVDAGLVHQMVHMHGSIVSSGKGIRLAIFAILLIGPVLLVDSTTMAEDPFNSLTIITMDKRAEQLDRTFINNPDLVATDAVISFKTTIWFWMTPQGNKPSSHDVISGRWTPSAADRSAGRVPGYGVITNIINGSVGKAQMIRWLIGLGSSGGTATCWELAMDTT